MKKLIFTAISLFATLSCMAQDIKLPNVAMSKTSMSVVETLAKRHSVREYSDKNLTTQELSNLCWAACGVSRDNNHRTAPTAKNRKEIRLFVFTAENVYEYLPVENKLKFVCKGDNRPLVAGTKAFSQDFVLTAPISLVMVADFKLFGSKDEHAQLMTCVDAGIVSENINLYCESVGLATITRATMDVEGLRKLLNLTEDQLPILNNTVGYEKTIVK